jgi:hypothetical protein
LISTLELEEERIEIIHAHHSSSNPRARRTSNGKGQDTESKALVMSNFRKTVDERLR